METYTITGFWNDGDMTTDTKQSKEDILVIVKDCLGDGCVGFEIDLEEN